jgi:hypothetical protein
MKYNTTFFVESAAPGFSGACLSGESAENTLRHYGSSGQCTTAQQQKSEAAHTATKAGRVPAPVYSPDRSPGDFFLFGMLKERMSGTSDSSPDELISAMSELIASLPKYQLVSVYKNWMKHLNWVIKYRGSTTASE